MIDEAQHLDFEVLEQIRLLTNLETNTRKLLQIILIGQPELVALLNRPDLRQLNQRITARYNLEPLNREETSAYIRHRLQVAGLPPGRELFPPAVVRGIFKRTRGIPRLINVLCDRILLGTYGRNKLRADRAMLELAAREVIAEEPAMKGPVAKRTMMAVAGVVLLAVGVWFGDQQLGLRTAQKPVTQLPAVPELATVAPAISQAVVAPVTGAATAPAVEKTAAASWLLPPNAALARLWSLESSMPAPPALCSGAPAFGIACVENRAETWQVLRELDRPLALQMITPQRFGASVLLLGIAGADGYVSTDTGVALIGLAELGLLWSGRYQFLWHPPKGFKTALAMGDSSPVVVQIAALFARLDGQAETLAKNRFNAALKERVTLFQRQHQLEDDGVVGVRTLLKLNEQLGIDMTTADARTRLEQGADEMALR